jgi:hypothetical protein
MRAKGLETADNRRYTPITGMLLSEGTNRRLSSAFIGGCAFPLP